MWHRVTRNPAGATGLNALGLPRLVGRGVLTAPHQKKEQHKMKKLMIALAAVAMAAGVHAASLNWQILATPAHSPDATPAGYAVYLFQTAAGGTYGGNTVTETQILAALGSASTFATFAANNSIVSGKALNGGGGIQGATGYNGNNFGEGDTLSAIAVIVDATTAANMTAYMITAEKTVNWTSGTGSQNLAFASQAANTWNAVPEPTSGLLLLLGVAGLALRRRRA